MRLAQRQQFLPKVNVLGPLFVVEPPIILFPFHRPALRDGVHQILRIAVKRDFAWLLQHFETLDGGLDFHPVVGGQTKAAAGLGAFLGM